MAIAKPTVKRHRIFSKILLSFIVIVAILFIDSNIRIVTGEYALFYNNLPESFDGFRIVLLADIHATEHGVNNRRLISRVQSANPDIIVIAGDLLDAYRRIPIERQLQVAETLIAGLMPIAPVYFVTGNHEWDRRVGGPWRLFEMMEQHGVTVLRNQYVRLQRGDDQIILAGTDDPHGPADMTTPYDFVRMIHAAEGEDSFIVMLEHRNQNLPLYSSLGVDLVLCGHAHGGIIRLPFTDGLIGPQREWFPTHTSGVYTMGDTNMVVSRGLGNYIWMPRFLNNPHLVVAVLRAE